MELELNQLIERFKTSRDRQLKAIFSTLFIAENRLQTQFDRLDPDITLKQFMLLTMVRQSEKPLSFTQSGKLLGCSRQNIKKLACALEKNKFVEIRHNPDDVRASVIVPTEKLAAYFDTMAAAHQEKLNRLFAHYTDEEVQQLFQLLTKLYSGIEEWEKENKI